MLAPTTASAFDAHAPPSENAAAAAATSADPVSYRDAAMPAASAPPASAGNIAETVAAVAGAGLVAALANNFTDLLIPYSPAPDIDAPANLNQRDKIAWFSATLARVVKHSADRGAQLTGCQSALKLTTDAINLGVYVTLDCVLPASLPVPSALPAAPAPAPALVPDLAPAPELASAPVTAAAPSLLTRPRAASSLPAFAARPGRSAPLRAPDPAVPASLGLSAVVPTAVPIATSSRLPRPPLPDKFSGAADERTSVEFLEEVIFWLHLSGIPMQLHASWGITMLGDEAKRYMSGKLRDLAPEMTPSTMTWSEFGKILNAGYFKPQCRVANRVAVYELKQNRMSVPELSRELRRRAALCQPAVAEHDLITHFIGALRAPLRRVCGTDPTGSEWVDLNALVTFATIKEADLSLGDDYAGVRSGAATPTAATAAATTSARTSAGARSGSRAPSVGGKRKQAPGGSAGGASKRSTPSGDAGCTKFNTLHAEFTEQRAAGRCFYCNGAHWFGRDSCPHSADAAAGRTSPHGNTPRAPLTI